MNLVRALAVGGVLLALVAVSVEAAGGASKKTTNLIVGKWKVELKKNNPDDKVKIDTTMTIEFTKDGKIKATARLGDPANKEIETEGTYKLIDDTTLETTITEPGRKEAKTDKLWKIETLSKTKLVLLKPETKSDKVEFDRVK